MKKSLSIPLLFSMFLTNAMAATTGSVLLQGIVPQKISIGVASQPVAASLDLEVSQTDLKVATVNEQSNSRSGYKVTIISAGLGKLKRTDGAEVFPYTLKYGGAIVGLSSASGSVFSNTVANAQSVNKDLTISYNGMSAESMVEGIYADTITLNISAN